MSLKKTYKRELAVVLIVWFAYVVETKDAEIINMLVWPVFTYMALAFGVDWWGKSGGMRQNSSGAVDRGRTQRSSEYPSREDEHPDHWHIDR